VLGEAEIRAKCRNDTTCKSGGYRASDVNDNNPIPAKKRSIGTVMLNNESNLLLVGQH
jgi:hypothetical protein